MNVDFVHETLSIELAANIYQSKLPPLYSGTTNRVSNIDLKYFLALKSDVTK